MSTYRFQAKEKKTGEMVTGTAYDDHFGRHKYSYQLDGEKNFCEQKTFDRDYEMITDHEDPELDQALTMPEEYNDDPRTRTFLLTDACLWEMNQKQGTFNPHAIEVVDTETGQVRYIQSGSRIRFVEGDISDNRDQEIYNKYGQTTGE